MFAVRFCISGTIDDACTAPRKLGGRAGPSGNILHMELSCLLTVHTNRSRRWASDSEVPENKDHTGKKEGSML